MQTSCIELCNRLKRLHRKLCGGTLCGQTRQVPSGLQLMRI